MREEILALGKKMYSEQTGFIHLYYLDPLAKRQDTIPVVENLLYALALLRTRTSEQMLEGKDLLSKLLPYQSEEGNFPIYLHDYPNCKELFAAAKALPPLYWILKEFGTVAGPQVKTAFQRALTYCQNHIEQAPEHIAILIRAVSGDLERYRDEKYWYSPTLLGCLIIALQMNPSLDWPEFWPISKLLGIPRPAASLRPISTICAIKAVPTPISTSNLCKKNLAASMPPSCSRKSGKRFNCPFLKADRLKAFRLNFIIVIKPPIFLFQGPHKAALLFNMFGKRGPCVSILL